MTVASRPSQTGISHHNMYSHKRNMNILGLNGQYNYKQPPMKRPRTDLASTTNTSNNKNILLPKSTNNGAHKKTQGIIGDILICFKSSIHLI